MLHDEGAVHASAGGMKLESLTWVVSLCLRIESHAVSFCRAATREQHVDEPHVQLLQFQVASLVL